MQWILNLVDMISLVTAIHTVRKQYDTFLLIQNVSSEYTDGEELKQ